MSVKTKHSGGRSLGSQKWGRHKRKEFQFLSNMFLVEQSWGESRLPGPSQPSLSMLLLFLGPLTVSIPKDSLRL